MGAVMEYRVLKSAGIPEFLRGRELFYKISLGDVNILIHMCKLKIPFSCLFKKMVYTHLDFLLK